jgi:hypothetical protein
MQDFLLNAVVRDFVYFPCIWVYFIWWDRNSCIFQYIMIPMEVISSLIKEFYKESIMEPMKKKQRVPIMPHLDYGISWGGVLMAPTKVTPLDVGLEWFCS